MSALAGAAVAGLAGVALAHGAWWTLLAAAALRRPAGGLLPAPGWSFTVVVPAHDEEALLGATLDALRACTYDPAPELLVVADNCSDATAAVARARGASVLERTDPANRGKSFALEAAMAELARRPEPPHAVVFVDADTLVAPGFFDAIASTLDDGAEAVQAHYGVLPGETPLARLRGLAFALVHWARPLGASRLGLGTTLKGNGMALRWDVAAGGLGGSGLAEDAAMTLALARRGIAVRFAPAATVRGHMAAGYAAAGTQDRRWEGGRFALLPAALRATASALARRRLAAAAGAAEVAALPLTLVAAAAGGALVLALAAGTFVPLAASALVSLGVYAVTGWTAARVSPRELAVLAHVPRFVFHKLRVYAALALGRGPAAWERTSRSAP